MMDLSRFPIKAAQNEGKSSNYATAIIQISEQ
jgi:hypothetical protein